MSYVQTADFRPGSGKWYTRGIPLTDDDSDANALSDAIRAMSEAFDFLTEDHYEPEPGGFPEGTMTLDLDGSGGPGLSVPKRIRSITEVALRAPNGDLTVQDPSVYRVTKSLEADGMTSTEKNMDLIEIVQPLTGTGFWGGWSYSTNWWNWPIGTAAVQLTGTFSWLATPEDVKRAVALMVYDAIKPSTDVLLRAERWATPNASFTVGPVDRDHPTGLNEVDRIIKRFSRLRIPAI